MKIHTSSIIDKHASIGEMRDSEEIQLFTDFLQSVGGKVH